jgi:hypothetical protein
MQMSPTLPSLTRRARPGRGLLNVHPLEPPFSNGPADDRPGIRKKVVCVSGRSAIHFCVCGCPGLTGPSRPLSEMAGRGVKEAKTPIFISFYGEDPPRQPPVFGGGEGSAAVFFFKGYLRRVLVAMVFGFSQGC